MVRYFSTFIIFILFFSACSHQIDYTPDIFFGYRRTRILKGDEAKVFVDRIHFQAVAKDSNLIAFYEGKQKNAILYLTYYHNSADARADYQKMTQKISPENSVFIEGNYFKIKDKEIYRCFGMGQTHFVFYDECILFWMGLPTLEAHDFLDAYLNHIHH